MFDEVMTGFGRTGKWFGADHEGVVPDVMTFAKGVTSGYVPLGGAIVTERIARHFDDNVLWVGSTYSGHPLACAAGVASIEAYREDGLIDRSARMGDKLLSELRHVGDRHPSVGDVRGRGLFAAIELVKDRKSKEMLERWNGPKSPLANALKATCIPGDVIRLRIIHPGKDAGQGVGFVAGSATVMKRLNKVLEAICPRRTELGKFGDPLRTKLAINLILGLNRAALAEGLVLAERLGLDVAAFLELARGSAAYSQVMDVKGAMMARREFTPAQGRVAQSLKDFRLMLAQAGSNAQQLPFAAVYAEMLEDCVRRGEAAWGSSSPWCRQSSGRC